MVPCSTKSKIPNVFFYKIYLWSYIFLAIYDEFGVNIKRNIQTRLFYGRAFSFRFLINPLISRK